MTGMLTASMISCMSRTLKSSSPPRGIRRRSRIIQLAIDARSQRHPDETPYRYAPLAAEADALRWSEAARRDVLADYNLDDLGI